MRLGLVLLIICIAQGLFAQEVQWLDKEYAPLPDSANAVYFYNPGRVRTVYADPDSINIYVIHFASGPLHVIGGFEHGPDSRKWGRHVNYFQNGNKSEQGIYIDNARKGKWQGWYEDGSLHYVVDILDSYHYKGLEYVDSTGVYRTSQGQGVFRYCFDGQCETGLVQNGLKEGSWSISNAAGELTHRERYRGGELIEGQWVKENGVVSYDQILSSASFDRDGFGGFYSFIAQNLKYPQEARDREIEGKLYVQFTINPDGSIDGVEVFESPHPSLTRETLRVMSNAHEWVPARLRGEPVRQRIVTPLVFMLD